MGFMLMHLHVELMVWEGAKPDWTSYAYSISASANFAFLHIGKQLHHLIMKAGYINDLFVMNTLIIDVGIL